MQMMILYLMYNQHINDKIVCFFLIYYGLLLIENSVDQ